MNNTVKTSDIVGAPHIDIDVRNHVVSEFSLDQATSLIHLHSKIEVLPNLLPNLLPKLLPKILDCLSLGKCDACGEYLNIVKTENGWQTPATCLGLADYKKPIVVQLNVPSGQMVLGNDFREWFRVIGDFDISTNYGLRKTTERYAATVGMVYCFVGNTCPGMYRACKKAESNHFTIGPKAPYKGSRRVGGVCTDLWWYCLCDKDEFLKRAGEKALNAETIIDCEPGVYTITHEILKTDDRFDIPIWSNIVRTGDPLPVVDYAAQFMALDFTAEQIMGDACNRWSDLHSYSSDGKPVAPILPIMRAAGHMLMTSGNGYDHHPNGWISDSPDIDPNDPGIEIPVFDQAEAWYPQYDHSFLRNACEPKGPYLNPSFTRLAFNVLQAIIRYGVLTRGDKDPMHGWSLKAKEWAQKTLTGLAKRYPDRIPDFCKDLI